MPETSGEVPSLAARNFSLHRNSAKLGPLSFTLPHAGCWWLAGVSGAGKSLLMESLAGFHDEARGGVFVNGGDIGRCGPERRSIALMPQRWKLFPHWTVARNLRFAAKLGSEPRERIELLTGRLQMRHLLDRPTRALSGGETQRAVLIQTMLSPAKILLLDEPLSAIDAALQSVALDLLQEEAKIQQRICLIAAHKPPAERPMQGTLWIENGQLLSHPEME